MKSLFLLILHLAMPTLSVVEATLIDATALPARTVYDVANLTPRATTTDGTPAVLLLSLDAGNAAPPHATEIGLRLLTVLSGDMSWGEGSTIDEAAERTFGPGSRLGREGRRRSMARRSERTSSGSARSHR